jgi:hypothetical protein
MPSAEATAAVIFKIRRVEDRLLWEFEKIIIKFAIATEIITAMIKYRSVVLYSICFCLDRSLVGPLYSIKILSSDYDPLNKAK